MSDLTEAEARTKWCPMINRAGGYGNRDADGFVRRGSDCKCIGSACMMWRWHEPWTSSTEEGQGGDLVLRLSRRPGEPKRGFCGLANPPTT